MNKRERVMAALAGRPVDRVPVAFWLHNFATEHSPEGLAGETVRLARTFDWDFLKPQSRAQCFAEMWGLTYTPSAERATPHAVTRAPVAGVEDLRRLRPADPAAGALGEQLRALRAIRRAVGPEPPIIWTVFSPLMVMGMLAQGGRERAIRLARAEPAAMTAALGAMAETLAAYARLCLEAGADGLFYATNVGTRDLMTAEECRGFHRVHDLSILAAVRGAPFTLLHVCGDRVHWEEFRDYPVTAFSWATVPGNPGLVEGHRSTGRAVVGGLPAKPTIAAMSEAEVAERARKAIDVMEGRWLLLGPDCSVNPDTPEALLHAAGRVARERAGGAPQ